MKTRLQQIMASTAAAAILLATTIAQGQTKQDIVDTAVAAGSFQTLAAALQAAELVPALQGQGPFTVFAPTDEAFAKLPPGTVETLLKPENRDQLVAVLTYHVVPGQVAASQVVELPGAKTLNGQRVDIAVADGKVKVDDANVIKTDIGCANGIIHVIDTVLLPSSDNLVTTASKAGSFQTLLAAATAAGLADALVGAGPLTVFAPTDAAFEKLPAGTLTSLLKPENKGQLAAILKYHVVPGRVYSEDALAAQQAKTLQGSPIRFAVIGGRAMVNDAELLKTDIDASNGVIHVIDSVIMPPSDKLSSAQGREMIRAAVAHGSELYNAGHHSACAKVYMTTMRDMLQSGEAMPSEVRTSMRQVLSKAEHVSCPTQQSWTLRHGLDHAYARLAQQR